MRVRFFRSPEVYDETIMYKHSMSDDDDGSRHIDECVFFGQSLDIWGFDMAQECQVRFCNSGVRMNALWVDGHVNIVGISSNQMSNVFRSHGKWRLGRNASIKQKNNERFIDFIQRILLALLIDKHNVDVNA